MIGSWLQRLTPERVSKVRLICFPHAGGTASAFRLWPAGLPHVTEVLAVQYPGRGNRLAEPPVDRISVSAQFVCRELALRPVMPTVFFGHSMGSLVAFETARLLGASPADSPRHLVLSGRAPPHFPAAHAPIAQFPDAEFLWELDRRYAAIPAQIMQYPDVLALLLPALRADIAAVEHCAESARGRVTCPITAMGGADDPAATRSHLSAWHELTSGRFGLRLFPGGHFFIEPERGAVLDTLSAILEGVASKDSAVDTVPERTES